MKMKVLTFLSIFISIYSIQGQKTEPTRNLIGQEVPVSTSKDNNVMTVETQHLASGLYIVKLVSNEKTYSLKFKKE